jgi:FdhD protein
MAEAFESFDVLRVDQHGRASATDRVAAERPLDVRIEGEPFAVVMRTPGADADLAVGFLFAEGVLRRAADVRRVECGPADVVTVRLAPGCAEGLPDIFDRRRRVTANASCGVCGRTSLESLVVDGPPLPARWRIAPEVVAALPGRLRSAQGAFDETGGLHAAGLSDVRGALESSAEDIGRHNAVDKLIGRMLMAGRLPLEQSLLFVSGRASFEIVQKAFAAGIPFVAAVSAPSSLAVELARRTGITLLGFVRDGRFNAYAGHERLA